MHEHGGSRGEGGDSENTWRDQPTLTGDGVTLRPLVAADRAALVDAAADGRLWELFWTSVPSEETVDSWLARALTEQRHRRTMPFAVIDAAGRLVGSTSLLRMNEAHRRVEVGATFYRASAQRTALNSRCKLLMLGHAFGPLACNVVQIRTDWLNRPSRAAIERLGAKQDGVLRQHQIAADGRVRDIVVYSITAAEWPGVERALRLRLERGAR